MKDPKDPVEMLKTYLDTVMDSQPFYGERNKNYLCLFSKTISNSSVGLELTGYIKAFINVELKIINDQFLPDENCIYFLPLEEPSPIKFTHYPYSNHI